MVDEKTSLPAISANVFYGQSLLWSGHFGSKFSNSNNTKPDGNTVYRIGQVTKVFPVLLIYKLFEGGTIGSIDDPLNKYFPEFHIKNPFTNENITMREITCQMSGLPREAPCVITVKRQTLRSNSPNSRTKTSCFLLGKCLLTAI